MLDHGKIEEAIDSYFNNTPNAKIIENLDRHSLARKEDLDREVVCWLEQSVDVSEASALEEADKPINHTV